MTNCETVGLEHRWTADGALCVSCGLVRRRPKSIIRYAARLDFLRVRAVHLDGKLPPEQSELYRLELENQLRDLDTWLERWYTSARATGLDV